jgi:uncharacterized membrane protein
LEAFSDAVIAIVMTVMVLELRPPDEPSWTALTTLAPNFLVYLLSFVYLGIYWNNHHHLLQATARVNGTVLWANLHLLFWLSLFPVATGWLGGQHEAVPPTVFYGVVLLLAAIAYYVLQTVIVRAQGPGSVLEAALGRDLKGKASPVIYAAGIAVAYLSTWLALALYVVVALMWLVPDRRLEARISQLQTAEGE